MKNKRKPTAIIAEIRSLLSELDVALGEDSVSLSIPARSGKRPIFSGPSGGIRLLLSQGFFKEPKTLLEVSTQLQQEGFNYRKEVVSVALLRLVRDRTMVRLPATGQGQEKWVYAERK